MVSAFRHATSGVPGRGALVPENGVFSWRQHAWRLGDDMAASGGCEASRKKRLQEEAHLTKTIPLGGSDDHVVTIGACL